MSIARPCANRYIRGVVVRLIGVIIGNACWRWISSIECISFVSLIGSIRLCDSARVKSAPGITDCARLLVKMQYCRCDIITSSPEAG
eukprot:6984144-Prymnesium_polylepis.1